MDRNKIKVIQKELQIENLCFDHLIYALEKLEAFLINEREGLVIPIQTVVGTDRDPYKDPKISIAKESLFSQVKLQCQTVFMSSGYDDEEISSIAIELFLSDILEWYSGRFMNDKYDEVDLCIIPIISSITRNADDVVEVYEKFVHVPERFNGDKEEMMRNVLLGWIVGSDDLGDRLNKEDWSDEIIQKHARGSKFDGYKYLIKALMVLCDSSTPVKSFIHAINQYLPDIPSCLPDVNDETIDKYFDDKNKTVTIPDSDKKSNRLANLLPKLKEMIRGILDNEKIDYTDIDIKIK